MLSKVKQITRKLYCIFDGITLHLPALNSENLFTPKFTKLCCFQSRWRMKKKPLLFKGYTDLKNL